MEGCCLCWSFALEHKLDLRPGRLFVQNQAKAKGSALKSGSSTKVKQEANKTPWTWHHHGLDTQHKETASLSGRIEA